MTTFLGANTYAVESHGGSYVDGEWVDGAPVASTAYGSIQPISGRDRELLEEGTRARGRFVFHTETTLNIVSSTTPARGDTVSFEGRDYEVVADLNWTAHTSGLPHHTYILAEVTNA
jgi:hypothetical protein